MIDDELFEKVQRVFADDINLLGNFHFASEEINELKEEFLSAAKRNSHSFGYSIDEISYFAIVVINKLRDWDKEWSENGFWDQINQVFDDDYYIYVLISQFLIKLYDAIDSLFKKYNRVLFKSKGGKRAFAQTFLYHALAPRYSLESFVDLAWRKYFDDLECDYSVSDIIFCEYVINSLKKKIASPDEDTDVQFGSAYYRLRTAFKYGIVQDTEKTIKLLDNVLLLIDRVDRSNEDLEENIINRVISSVVAKNKRVITRGGGREASTCKSSNTSHSFSQLRPALNIDFAQHEKPTIQIRFPRLILLGNENECKYVDIYLYREEENGKKTLIRQFLRRNIKNNGEHSCTLSAFSEDLTDIYYLEQKNYHYEFQIIPDSGDGYYSKKEFYRDFLIFGNDKEISGNTKPGNYYLVVPKEFNISEHLHLLRNDYRLLWKNIYNIVSEDFDSIEYENSIVLFSRQGMPSNVKFEDQSLSPLDGISIRKNDKVYEVYKSFSNLLINKDDDTSPELIRICHTLRDPFGNVLKYDEKRLSDLPLINHRYCFDNINYNLSGIGFHALTVTKISNNVLSNKFLLNKHYIIDDGIKIQRDCVPYLNGDCKGNLKIFGVSFDYIISSNSEESELELDCFDACAVIQNLFFHWSFGTSLNDIHYSQINLKKPIITSEFKSTNETIVVNSALSTDKLYFQSTLGLKPVEVFSGSEENIYLLSQFINAGHKKGYFFCKYNDIRIPLFAITDMPYGSESIDLGDCLLLDDKNLKIDVREYFIHDDANYNVYLTLNDSKGKIIKLKLQNADEENVFKNTNIEDGKYKAHISFAKVYIGEEESEVSLHSFDIILGDINKKAFIDIDRIELKPARDFATQTKLKMEGYYIDSISYFGYDEIGDCVFNGMLKSKKSRPQKVRFTHKDGRLIKNLTVVFGKEDEIIKKVNFDTSKNCFTTNPVSNTVSEFKSIYYKK